MIITKSIRSSRMQDGEIPTRTASSPIISFLLDAVIFWLCGSMEKISMESVAISVMISLAVCGSLSAIRLTGTAIRIA